MTRRIERAKALPGARPQRRFGGAGLRQQGPHETEQDSRSHRLTPR
jgi:hypothetical protein